LVTVALPFLILTPQHNPFKRGFFCNDESIRYPLKDDTISYQLLGGVMIPFTLIVVSLILLFFFVFGCFFFSIKGAIAAKLTLWLPGKIRGGPGGHSFVTCLEAIYTIGRWILPVCQPSWDKINCNAGGYVENFTCSGERFWLSFYSGHSSFSMYCMMFIVLYIQARLKSNWTRLLRPTFQFFLIATAVYVGLSRVSDYKHHWSDVLMGLLQGGLVAILNVVCVTNFFKQPFNPVVSQEEEDATQTNLQENPSRENHYGSTG
ncbi:hypothetical protein NQD34_007264, partial [Periophthalmus magnuspinnatus]